MIKNKDKKAASLHPRNLHQGSYDFTRLTAACPALNPFVTVNPKGQATINFSDPQAVLLLNQALLKCFYDVDFWQIPEGYLCPPIPGRADYIHYLADLLAETFNGEIPSGKKIKALDIGSGANCIYPIIGSQSYGWSFVGSDIDPLSVKTASLIVKSNAGLKDRIKLILQKNDQAIFSGIIKKQDKFVFSMCNPPFHASMDKALAGSTRKMNNLNKGKAAAVKLNFGGQENELCCAGGEIAFLKLMSSESKNYAGQVCWFSSLVSKSENIAPLKKLLAQLGAEQVKVIKMSQGQKVSRLIAWSFLTQEEQVHFISQ
ncbi:23S rRNA (adenine(1618)-N(6))-methyltransferase RlmF [Psychromonas aquimarina]|uniref:23S rRNA (adenine(1618)-N(6))-methyltransferase RlmF n=1 Tax=Psychromonas aquimarina TaxID=444919 RepID=UPI00042096F1|nr:23S rRNA (adenine(1618)-N(6))-methyltransferase RlmF [Psychromonas aquimarina]